MFLRRMEINIEILGGYHGDTMGIPQGIIEVLYVYVYIYIYAKYKYIYVCVCFYVYMQNMYDTNNIAVTKQWGY